MIVAVAGFFLWNTLVFMGSSDTPENGTATLTIVTDALPGVLELRASGVVLLPSLRTIFRELAALRARRPELRSLLFDASAVERFGRGAVVESARWVTRNAALFELAVTITHSPSLKSAIVALSPCAPSLRQLVVAEREQALRALEAPGSVAALTG